MFITIGIRKKIFRFYDSHKRILWYYFNTIIACPITAIILSDACQCVFEGHATSEKLNTRIGKDGYLHFILRDFDIHEVSIVRGTL